jgi:hypothetical protein
MLLLPIHIPAGLLAIAVGYAALAARKGGTLHRKSGMIFVYSMMVMALSGALIALLKPDVSTMLGGLVAPYFVATGLLTVRPRDARTRRFDVIALVTASALTITYLTFGLEALESAAGRKNGYPPPLFFIFGTIVLIAAIGDLRVLVSGIRGAPRIARHLWRMCFATFIATGSFFLGQAKVIPKPIRIMPLLATLALLPLVLMLYWLWRVRARRAVLRARTDHPGLILYTT